MRRQHVSFAIFSTRTEMIAVMSRVHEPEMRHWYSTAVGCKAVNSLLAVDRYTIFSAVRIVLGLVVVVLQSCSEVEMAWSR